MNIEGYESFDAWKADMDRVKAHPNDRTLFQHVVMRVENSSKKIKNEVQDYLSGISLEKNPWLVFQQIAKENKQHMLLVNGQEDPWFHV